MVGEPCRSPVLTHRPQPADYFGFEAGRPIAHSICDAGRD